MVQDITIRDTELKRTAQIASEWERVVNALNPKGKVPTVEQLKNKFKKVTATVRDGIIARMYSEGVLFKMSPEVIEEDFPRIAKKVNDFQANFQSQRYDETTKGLKTTNTLSGLLTDINTFAKGILKINPDMKDSLNLNIDKFEELIEQGAINDDKWSPTRKRISDFKKGKLYKETKGAKKGTRILKEIDSKKILKIMLSNIAQIKDINMKGAILVSMFGQRGEALVNMSNSLDNATRYGVTEYVPFYDPVTKEIVNPTDRSGFTKKGGRKLLPPTTKVGPLIGSILDYMHKNTKGDLFKVKKTDLVNTLNNVVYKGIGPDLEAKLGRSLTGYTDLRRIFASTVINEMASRISDPEIKVLYFKYADQLLGHNNTKTGVDATNDLIAKIMREHYAVIKEGTSILKPGDIMGEFEKFFAEAMGATDAEGKLSANVLASSLGIDDKQIDNLDKIYIEKGSDENPNKQPSDNTKKKIVNIKQNVEKNAETQSKLNVITGQRDIDEAVLANYNYKLEQGKTLKYTGTDDEIVKQVEDLIAQQSETKTTTKKPLTVNKDLVNNKLAQNMKKAKELGMSLRQYIKSIAKDSGGKLGLVVGGTTLLGGLTAPEDARAGDFISMIAPIGMEPSYVGGKGQGFKYPGTDNILTGEEEQLLRERNPEMYKQIEATFKQEQAYQQEQEKIKEEFKKEEQAKEMNRLFSEPLMP